MYTWLDKRRSIVLFDIVIKNGNVVDPEKKILRKLNIGIYNGKFTAITTENLIGNKVIDASNLIISPGFIDVHGHVDGDEYCGELSLIQGVTTTVGGNCGLSPIEMNAFFEKQDNSGFPINQAELIGHSFSMRNAVGIQNVYSPATLEEVNKMKYITEKALEEGACGLSFGLDYAPNSSFDGIIELSKVVARKNKLVAIHTRMTSDDDLASLSEAINISKITGAAVLVSHFIYQYNEIMDEALSLVDKVLSEGLNIRIDSGMYTSWATSIGTATFSEDNIYNGSLELSRMLAASGKHKGKHLNLELYKELRKGNPHECIIYLCNDETNIYKALNKEYAMPSSDTGPYEKGEGHPQISGTFPKFIKNMVRTRKEIDIIEAVRKSTLLPAETIGLKNKGRILEGMDADLTIFDINNITDTSDFPDKGSPDSYPEGINYVIVNGKLAVSNNNLLNTKAGKTIRI